MQLKTQQQFLKEAREIHADRYGYEKVDYIKGTAPVLIICRVHGEFQQTPFKHLQGQGCRRCPKKSSLDQVGFEQRARNVHGDRYEYGTAVYKGSHEPVIVTCKTHGPFSVVANEHFRGCGCKECHDEGRLFTMEQWLEAATRRHGTKYDYSNVTYIKSTQPVTIRCKAHGDFQQISNSHLQGSGCPRCSHRVSKPSIEWLDAMAQMDDTHIQHRANGGEVRLAGTRWHADGFSADLNKVYEFHGDYYHGNPRRYPSDTQNKTCKRSMGELYENTCKRRQVIENLGYAYEDIWEDELNAAKTLLTLCDVRA